MNTNKVEPEVNRKRKKKFPFKTLIEILPLIIALTALFSYNTIKSVSDVELITPLSTVLGSVPLWVATLMALVTLLGILGMGLLIYIFARAPISLDD